MSYYGSYDGRRDYGMSLASIRDTIKHWLNSYWQDKYRTAVSLCAKITGESPDDLRRMSRYEIASLAAGKLRAERGGDLWGFISEELDGEDWGWCLEIMELFEYNDAPDKILQKGLDHKSAKVHEAAWRADYHKRSQEEEDERKKKEKEERDRNSYIAPLSYYSYFY